MGMGGAFSHLGMLHLQGGESVLAAQGEVGWSEKRWFWQLLRRTAGPLNGRRMS